MGKYPALEIKILPYKHLHLSMAPAHHIGFVRRGWGRELVKFVHNGLRRGQEAYQGKQATLTGGFANFLRTGRGAVEKSPLSL